MPGVVENEEKVFQYYFYLPKQARMEIIDSMNTSDRCRFRRCSKWCNIEATSSKNYIYSLEFSYISKNRVQIKTCFGKFEMIPLNGFVLNLEEQSGKKVVIYESLFYRELWRTELNNSTDIFQQALQYFKNVLRFYQNTIKQLSITNSSPNNDSDSWKIENLEIKSLDNLERLVIKGDVDLLQILPKCKKPLQFLCVSKQPISSQLVNYEQLYQVQYWLDLRDTELNFQQLAQLSAKNAFVSIGKLTERDIFNFIRAWQNGTIGMKLICYRWYLRNSSFNNQKLLNLLRLHGSPSDLEDDGIEIKHYIKPGKSATFWCSETELCFDNSMDLVDD